ncbi:hypothetical protein SEA_SCHATZIE_209 [Mycobacterium phage Schatzie]|nr:hypothetical protein SEA_SCHATZIE_209 [Mycobacterium phage Schatzie]
MSKAAIRYQKRQPTPRDLVKILDKAIGHRFQRFAVGVVQGDRRGIGVPIGFMINDKHPVEIAHW